MARQDAAKRGVDEIMVIGGSDVFADTMPMADRLEITHVHAAPKGRLVFSLDRPGRVARGGACGAWRGPRRQCQFLGRDLFKALRPSNASNGGFPARCNHTPGPL